MSEIYSIQQVPNKSAQVVQHSEWSSVCSCMHSSMDPLSRMETQGTASLQTLAKIQHGLLPQRPDATKRVLPVVQYLPCQSSGEAWSLEGHCLPEGRKPAKRCKSAQYGTLQEPHSTTAPDTGKDWHFQEWGSSSCSLLSSGTSPFSTLPNRDLITQRLHWGNQRNNKAKNIAYSSILTCSTAVSLWLLNFHLRYQIKFIFLFMASSLDSLSLPALPTSTGARVVQQPNSQTMLPTFKLN